MQYLVHARARFEAALQLSLAHSIVGKHLLPSLCVHIVEVMAREGLRVLLPQASSASGEPPHRLAGPQASPASALGLAHTRRTMHGQAIRVCSRTVKRTASFQHRVDYAVQGACYRL
jgi:hypothetical protein